MSDKFEQTLAFGKIGESYIASWLRHRCRYTVLPIYPDGQAEQKIGPRLLTPDRPLIVPDLLAMRGQDVKWIEAKRKRVWSWHRKSSRWVTGIDIRHYEDYLRVAKASPWPVWLLFLHESDVTNEPPYRCPVGLFGGELTYLNQHENHRHANWGKSGMVYWSHQTLKLLASLEEVTSAVEATRRYQQRSA